MELYEELEPMMWATISGVDEDKIHSNTMTRDERIRVERAIEILQDTELYLEDEENYDISFLSHTMEHYKTEYNIGAVAIDYLELTSALTSEYTQMTRGMGVREDQVLLNLSANIKNLAKRLDVAVIGFTQTTDEARRDGVRDQRAVKGARSLPNKCDLGMVSFAPTKKELELLEDVIEKVGLNNYRCIPNICYSIYKNRGGKFKNIKIWGYQDLGTMEYVDLFCTDESYAPINVDKTVLMPNLAEDVATEITEVNEEMVIAEYKVNDETGEVVYEDTDKPVELDDFNLLLEYEEPVMEETVEESEEELAFKQKVAEYNESILEQYSDYTSAQLDIVYDENGLIDEVKVVELTEESEETKELENPFEDLPIIDEGIIDELLEEMQPTLGKKRKGF